MCGRFALESTSEQLAKVFHLAKPIPIEPRYNIAPSQDIVIIRNHTGNKIPSLARWGLIPNWSKEEKTGYKLINARSETLYEKPAFREDFQERRCLIPATGYFEWQPKGSRKQPYFIKMKNGSVFAMAGLWESWRSPDGKIIESCAIITTAANGFLSKIHERMPAIIPLESIGLWLSTTNNDPKSMGFLQPYSPFKMTAYLVNGMVNNPKNEGPGCTRKISYTL
ncbi:MAG: SOS response-associated peptidase [Pseudomonadota bacterium]